jgi:uncharacterized protein YyaL (SSP411 family)
MALVSYAALTGSSTHRAAAQAALGVVSTFGVREPRFLGWGLAAAEGLVAGPVQVAVVGDSAELTSLAWLRRPPGAVVVSGTPDEPGVPLLAERPLVGGEPAAYVCHGFVCDLPTTSAAELERQLSPQRA